jgi:hypothetical protein
MAAAGPSKAELQDTIDSAVSVLSDAYAPESTREELATAVGQALDILNGEDDDSDDDDSDHSDDSEEDEEGE